MPRFCAYHILASSVIYYWTDTRQHGIDLFYIITKQTTAGKAFLFQNLWRTRREAIWRNLLPTQNEAISLVTMHCKELWLVQENHATRLNLTRTSLLVGWKLTAKAELNCAGKLQKSSQFLWALRAEKLGRCLEYWRSWKITLGKLVVAINLEAFWFEFWMKGGLLLAFPEDGGNFLSSVVSDSQISFDIVSETHFSCSTIGR